jgi:3-deoxy-D-manno-octulosonic-acid transferase
MAIIIYNFFLSFLILIFGPFLFTRYKFDKILKHYEYWIHCASLGEVKIALRLIDVLKNKLQISKENILLTTTTISAKNFAKKLHNETYIFPLDYFFISRNSIRIIRPKVLIILETELWPNCVYFVKKYGGKIFVLNGRMTLKTFVFLKVFRWLFKGILESIDYYVVREKIDYLRLKNLGINENKIEITGNMKYDDIDSFEINVSRKDFNFSIDDFVITFGSIREKEEKEVIKVVKKFNEKENIKFILAPRHLNLIKKIERLLKKNKITYILRSKINQDYNKDFKCLIIDTYGELKKFYSISDVVFVCGTILPYGGQSIIEPASLGKLVIFGRYISNFLDTAKVLLSNSAAIQIEHIEDLEFIIERFYKNRNEINLYGEKAKKIIYCLKGVTKKNVDIIAKHL